VSGRLDGKVAVVTGATEGIGYAIAHALAREGALQVLVARRAEPGARLVEELGEGRVAFVRGDVADPETADRTVTVALERFGALDVLVNNAALDLSGVPLFETTREQAREVVDANVFGPLMLLACGRHGRARRRSIVNITSRSARRDARRRSTAPRKALHALTRRRGRVGVARDPCQLGGTGLTDTR
jgi:3-oxoacyl-[acyl-carrier protein] reductase